MVQAAFTVIQEPVSCIKVADHDRLILCNVLEEARVQLMVLPHLHDVYDLADVVA
jgi:hypothetical protein